MNDLCETLGHSQDSCVYPQRGGEGNMKLAKIGAGWKRTATSGVEYVSISLDSEKLKLVKPEDYKKLSMFTNKFKETDKQPDFQIMVPMEE